MNLDEILIEVQKKAIENVDLKNEKEQKEKTLAEILDNNFKTLVKPELEKIQNIITVMTEKTNHYICKGTDSIYLKFNADWEEFRILSGDSFLFLSSTIYGFQIPDWNDKFSTEEKSLAFLDKIKSEIALILKEYAECLENENSSLKASVEKLTEFLTDSSSVKEREDGSVIININGKTYIGKVQEE